MMTSDERGSLVTEPLLITFDDAVAIISVNDAPYNRMTLDFVDLLEAQVDELARNDKVRAVVITAEGLDNFSVGMNLKQLAGGIEQAGDPNVFFDQRLRVTAAIENMGKPWIATLFALLFGRRIGATPWMSLSLSRGGRRTNRITRNGPWLGSSLGRQR